MLSDGRIQACYLDRYRSLAYTESKDVFEKPLKELWQDHEGIDKQEFLSGDAAHETYQKGLDRGPARSLKILLGALFVHVSIPPQPVSVEKKGCTEGSSLDLSSLNRFRPPDRFARLSTQLFSKTQNAMALLRALAY